LLQGIPDEKTFSRLFAWINPTELAVRLGKWLKEVREAGGGEIDILRQVLRPFSRSKWATFFKLIR
jgi:hypothetical protein